MGQEEIKEVLIKERKCSNDDYLTVRDIHKALSNMGTIIRIETLYKNVNKLHKYGTLESESEGDWRRRYRIKSKYLNI